jgi:hypothetical protein
VDFRDLVKDLAYIFKTRIELRQIGVRDEAKMLGGLGSCGRPVCCNTFLSEFQPVSIRMAKEQKLSLSPTKISGLCGRLMCCLKYEQDAYESMRKLMPKVGRDVITADGKGTVLENNAITERTKVRITLQDGTPDVREYHFNDVRKPAAPEEDAALQQELQRLAQERAVQTRHEEEEFRFVTGAAPIPAEAVPAPQQESANTMQKRTGRRKPRGRDHTASGESHASSPTPPRPQPPRREKGAQTPEEGNAQAHASAESALKKPGRSSRRGRNRRRKPSPNAPAPTAAPPRKDNR